LAESPGSNFSRQYLANPTGPQISIAPFNNMLNSDQEELERESSEEPMKALTLIAALLASCAHAAPPMPPRPCRLPLTQVSTESRLERGEVIRGSE
jgi:hypothetical protein